MQLCAPYDKFDKIAQQYLNLEKVFIIYPGIKSYFLDHETFVMPLKDINSSEMLRQL